MYVARIAPLDERSVDPSLNANDCTKLKLQELAPNVHICSVAGHVIAVEAEGADESDVLQMTDTSELLCFDTEYIAGGPNPVHEV